MCKYCQIDELSNYSDDLVAESSIRNDYGECLISTDVRIGYSDAQEAGLLAIGLWFGNSVAVLKEVKIKYCPFCGREIKRET